MKNKVLIIILVICYMFCNYSSIYASQSFTPSPLRGQEKSNWCWAVAVGLRASYGGHMVAITGYDTYDDTVWLQDPQGRTSSFPANGYETWTTYESLISGDYSQNNFAYLQNYSWNQSVN